MSFPSFSIPISIPITSTTSTNSTPIIKKEGFDILSSIPTTTTSNSININSNSYIDPSIFNLKPNSFLTTTSSLQQQANFNYLQSQQSQQINQLNNNGSNNNNNNSILNSTINEDDLDFSSLTSSYNPFTSSSSSNSHSNHITYGSNITSNNQFDPFSFNSRITNNSNSTTSNPFDSNSTTTHLNNYLASISSSSQLNSPSAFSPLSNGGTGSSNNNNNLNTLNSRNSRSPSATTPSSMMINGTQTTGIDIFGNPITIDSPATTFGSYNSISSSYPTPATTVPPSAISPPPPPPPLIKRSSSASKRKNSPVRTSTSTSSSATVDRSRSTGVGKAPNNSSRSRSARRASISISSAAAAGTSSSSTANNNNNSNSIYSRTDNTSPAASNSTNAPSPNHGSVSAAIVIPSSSNHNSRSIPLAHPQAMSMPAYPTHPSSSNSANNSSWFASAQAIAFAHARPGSVTTADGMDAVTGWRPNGSGSTTSITGSGGRGSNASNNLGMVPLSAPVSGSKKLGKGNLDDVLEDPSQKQADLQLEKRRKRRESHNAVERRRRDNINDRITELASLLPECLLDQVNNPEPEPSSPNGSISAPSPFSPPSSILSLPSTSPSLNNFSYLNNNNPHLNNSNNSIGSASQSAAAAAAAAKPNKGIILAKSVEYIRYLQQLVELHSLRNGEMERMMSELRVSNNHLTPTGSSDSSQSPNAGSSSNPYQQNQQHQNNEAIKRNLMNNIMGTGTSSSYTDLDFNASYMRAASRGEFGTTGPHITGITSTASTTGHQTMANVGWTGMDFSNATMRGMSEGMDLEED